MSLRITPHVPQRGKSIALWGGLVGAPAIWAIQLQIGYAVAPLACGDTKTHLILHALTVVCVLLSGLGGYLSWTEWKGAGAGSPEETGGSIAARARFMGALGMAVSATAALTILAQGIASFFFEGCWQ